jgi:hypothetical protein
VAGYALLTTWLLDGTDRTAAWDTLADVLAWPSWWPGAQTVVELAAGRADRVGSRYRVVWRAALGYSVRFNFAVEEVMVPEHMAGRATGDLEGRGVWRLFQQGGVTAVTYQWDVRTTRRLVNVVTPLARPLLLRNHDRIMRAGGRALAHRLGARLLSDG